MHKETLFNFAVKIIPAAVDDTEEDQVTSEIEILKKCSHPNVVSYFGSLWEGSSLWVSRW